MSITLDNSDFQCLQDQLVDLKTKNYELAQKNRRFQADFEAAKAKISSLQLKLEEQERDFEVTSTTLRQEIVAVTGNTETNKENKENDDYKAKYKKLLSKAKELQQRYEKSLEVVQQLDNQNKSLNEKVKRCEEDQVKLKEELEAKQVELDAFHRDYQEKLNSAIEEFKSSVSEEQQNYLSNLEAITEERDNLRGEVDRLTAEVSNFDHRLESQAEERKIHDRKGLQIVKELKRQLALEKNRTETLQKRLESLLSEPLIASDLESRSRLSTSSSTNGNSNGSSNGNGSRTNQDANSVGSWSFVPVKTKSSNQALNETLSLCSIDSEDRETVQQPCDTKSENSSMQQIASSNDSTSAQNLSSTASNSSPNKQSTTNTTLLNNDDSRLVQNLGSPSSNHCARDGMLIEEQAALVERLTRLQHDKWMLEEKLSYLEQANSSLSEDLANKSDIIKQYFLNQALKSAHATNEGMNSLSNHNSFNNANFSRRTSFQNNVSHVLADKPSLKKVVDFLKERSQVSSLESENISKEATKKMQLMLEETLIKCLKLQENLDHVTSELNKLKD